MIGDNKAALASARPSSREGVKSPCQQPPLSGRNRFASMKTDSQKFYPLAFRMVNGVHPTVRVARSRSLLVPVPGAGGRAGLSGLSSGPIAAGWPKHGFRSSDRHPAAVDPPLQEQDTKTCQKARFPEFPAGGLPAGRASLDGDVPELNLLADRDVALGRIEEVDREEINRRAAAANLVNAQFVRLAETGADPGRRPATLPSGRWGR